MVRTSLYDRISEKRLADEALAREKELHAASAPPIVPEPEPVPVLPLELTRNEITVAGLKLVMPQRVNFQEISITLEKDGHPITLTITRRPVRDDLTLNRYTGLYLANLRERHPDIDTVRQRDCLLAGNAAVALDYLLTSRQGLTHGRAINAITTAENGDKQWLCISTMIDPDTAALADWLIDFDAVLEAIVAH
ncbi:hypothetical protein [Pseudomonas sp. B20]|uniref:hypothetical protein n=1 Tax=Pseudomonas sp. B20 TaxID=129268 RepID=UPI001CFABC97|nr:hypothetical protein [Pseudomonas sp. B20]